MYLNAKNAINIENYKSDVMYSIIFNANDEKDLFITYKTQENDYTEYLILENEELHNKKYDIIIGDYCIYYDVIKKGKNIFPVNDIPFGKILYHKILIIVKNIKVDELELVIKNKVTNKNIEVKELQLVICKEENKKYYSEIKIDFPIISPKNDFFFKNKINSNVLIINSGLASLLYNEFSNKNNYNDKILNSSIKTIVICDENKYKMIKINTPNDDIYYTNKLLSLITYYQEYDIITHEKKPIYDIVMHNTEVNMTQVLDGVFEHLLSGDAFTDMSFICENEITKITFYKSEMPYFKEINKDLPFIKIQDGYKLLFTEKNMIPHLSCVYNFKIIVHTTNNTPVKIKFYTCVILDKKLRHKMIYMINSKIALLEYKHYKLI